MSTQSLAPQLRTLDFEGTIRAVKKHCHHLQSGLTMIMKRITLRRQICNDRTYIVLLAGTEYTWHPTSRVFDLESSWKNVLVLKPVAAFCL